MLTVDQSVSLPRISRSVEGVGQASFPDADELAYRQQILELPFAAILGLCERVRWIRCHSLFFPQTAAMSAEQFRDFAARVLPSVLMLWHAESLDHGDQR